MDEDRRSSLPHQPNSIHLSQVECLPRCPSYRTGRRGSALRVCFASCILNHWWRDNEFSFGALQIVVPFIHSIDSGPQAWAHARGHRWHNAFQLTYLFGSLDWVKHASFLLIASFGVASSFVLKAIYQIPRRLRWASLLFCFAAAIIAAQPDKGTGLLTMARDSASRLPQNASHLGRTILYPVDNAYPEVTIQDVSAEPQAVVLQQRNELSNALQLSMPNNEMSINLLASSDAFRSLAR